MCYISVSNNKFPVPFVYDLPILINIEERIITAKKKSYQVTGLNFIRPGERIQRVSSKNTTDMTNP